MKHLSQKVLSLLISCTLLSQPLMANTNTSAQEQRTELVNYLETQQSSYKKHFDKEMLLEEMDYDVEKIIDFMSNKIVYQAYDGILRGVEGTLIGRAGNAHDQALTLASMLNDADVEAQILVGKLNKEQTKELNQNIASPLFPELAKIDKSKQPKILKSIFSKVEAQKDVLEKKSLEIYAENEKIAQNIYNHIPKEALEKGKQAFEKELHQSTVSYRWVRYRNSPQEEWIEVHPAYDKAKQWKLSATAIEAGSVNPNDLQKLSIELFIENSDGKKHSITGKWTAPSANLTGKPIAIELVSDALINSNADDNLTEQFEKSKYFFVKINNSLTQEGKVFDLKGEIYNYSILSNNGKKIDAATDMFSNTLSFGKNNKETIKSIKRIWLEFTTESPNLKDTTIIRNIFDNNIIKKSQSIASKIIQRWDLDIATTTPMIQYYQNKTATKTIKEFKVLSQFKNKLKNKEKFIKIISSLANLNTSKLNFTRKLFNSFNQNDFISYMNTINILSLRHGMTNNSIYNMTDIVSNQRLSFQKSNHKLLSDIKTSIKHGVWETNAEKVKAKKTNNSHNIKSAFNVLKKINNYEINIIDDESFKLYDDINKKDFWNVDIVSGSTLGMITLPQGNAGGETVEYATLMDAVAIGVTVGAFTFGVYDCMTSGEFSNLKSACCVAWNGAAAILFYHAICFIATEVAVSASTEFGMSIVGDGIGSFMPNVCE